MKVVLLAAGRSRRMQPIEDKNFLNFLGKPLIQHQLEMLKKAGLKDLIIVGGKHNMDKIRGMAKGLGMKVEIVEQKELELGMCGAVLAAKKFLKKEPVMVVSSNDVVEEKAFEVVLAAAKKEKAESFILGKKVREYFPGGYLKIGKNGLIQDIVEKPKPGTEPSDMINLVVHLHTDAQKLIEYLGRARSKSDDLYEVALAAMMKNGVKMMAVPYSGFWQPIKYPWHVQKVFLHFMEKARGGIDKSVMIAKTAVVTGKVVMGKNVKIMDNAVVQGPAYIGENSIVATNALVRGSSVGNDCVIGFSSEVARSFLGNQVWTHSNYIGDSVIGNNVSFGAGTVTGNLRLDEGNIVINNAGQKMDIGSTKFGAIIGDHVRVGINTSIMPGVKIGENSMIGAGLVLAENVQPKSFVRGEWKLKISENKFDVGSLDRSKMRKKL